MSYDLTNELPDSLESAIKELKLFFEPHLAEVKEMSEGKFLGSTHFASGMYIRNSWQLWWYENHEYSEWSETKPLLNQWFNSIDIYHADDMSSILLVCFHRHLNNKPYDLDKQVARYKKHWLKQGFENGIYKQN